MKEIFTDILTTRRSIRKFSDEEISNNVIEELVRAAQLAPTACNTQCFYFVAVKDRELLAKVVEATEKGVNEFYCGCDEEMIKSRIKQTTFYKKAPLVIFAYQTDMQYHDKRVTEHYTDKGYSHNGMLAALGSPEIVTMGAALENLVLTAHSKGLGACLMSDPIVSEKYITEALGVDKSYRLLSVVPVGKPAYTPFDKKLKPLEEILEIR